MSRQRLSRVFIVALMGCVTFPIASQAGTGTCFLKSLPTTGRTAPTAADATYGFTATGVASGTNSANVPTGNVIRNGTIQTGTALNGGAFPANSSATTGSDPYIGSVGYISYTQLDASGSHIVSQQPLTIIIDMVTCLTTIKNNVTSETLSGVLVNGGDGLRIMSSTANLYMDYGTAQRL